MSRPYPGGYPHQPGPYGQPTGPGGFGGPPTGPGYPGPPTGPGHGAPEYGAPGYGGPEHGAPEYGAPGYGAPGYGASGYGGPGYGAPGYGQPGPWFGARGPSTAMAYVTAIAFLPAIAMLYLSAAVSTDPTPGDFAAHMRVLLTGSAFVDMSTDVVDAMIAVTFSYPSVLLLCAVLLLARLGVARWAAAVLGFLGFAYYVYAPVKLTMLGFEAGAGERSVRVELAAEYATFPLIVASVLLVASIVAVLPATGRAMRGYRPKTPMGPGYGPPGYGPGF